MSMFILSISAKPISKLRRSCFQLPLLPTTLLIGPPKETRPRWGLLTFKKVIRHPAFEVAGLAGLVILPVALAFLARFAEDEVVAASDGLTLGLALRLVSEHAQALLTSFALRVGLEDLACTRGGRGT